jgi:hypothetical protein
MSERPPNPLVHDFSNQLQLLLSSCELFVVEVSGHEEHAARVRKAIDSTAGLARRIVGSVTAIVVTRTLAASNPMNDGICSLCGCVQNMEVNDPLAHLVNCAWRLAVEWTLLNPSI